MERIIVSPGNEEILKDSGFYWREKDGIKILVSRRLEDAGFINAFSTRGGGVSPFPSEALNLAGFKDDSRENIYENRRRFLAAVGGDFDLALAFQVHGNNILKVVGRTDAEDSDVKADAIISDAVGVLAAVKTADCVPILVGDPGTGSFAAVHAGWRGTLQYIVAKAAASLQECYDSQPAELIAAIGPSASCDVYEVGPEVIEQFTKADPSTAKYFASTKDDHATIDLPSINREQLISAGLRSENISIAPLCTMSRTDLFFSYRIEKKTYGNGRMLSVIGRSRPASSNDVPHVPNA
jgi:YfiH family protein